MPARLVFDAGDADSTEINLEGVVTFGRSPENDYVLAGWDGTVSVHHASIKNDRGRYTIRDEGSTSGTFVNRHRVGEQQLKNGDVVEFGLDGPTARFESTEGEVTVNVRPALRRSGWRGLMGRIVAFLLGRD